MICAGYSWRAELAETQYKGSRGPRIRTAVAFRLALACVLGLGLKLCAAENVPGGTMLKNFDGYAIHTFPKRGRVRDDKARKLYRIESTQRFRRNR
jgi:hypothetical protein